MTASRNGPEARWCKPLAEQLCGLVEVSEVEVLTEESVGRAGGVRVDGDEPEQLLAARTVGGDGEQAGGQAFWLDVYERARETLVGLIRSVSVNPIPRRELEPLAELLSMGMASLVLWWIDNPAGSRKAIVDAIARVWLGLLMCGDT